MKNRKILFILFITLMPPAGFCLFPQEDGRLHNFRVVCFNVENYFDCVDDPLTNDSEYLPGGIRGWNLIKYKQKQAGIAKTIAAIGGWETPALVGMCEVESRKALLDLTRYSPLKALDYKFIHYESPDVRGIDAALLYHPYQFFPISSEAVRVEFAADSSKTRDILYVCGTTAWDDTLHVFLVHFPSRLGGELESEYRRITAASVLRRKVDSIYAACTAPNVLVMGDFNDYPDSRSLVETLQARPLPGGEADWDGLYNLTYKLHKKGRGTHKHDGVWGMLDQFIVSGSLLNPANRIFTLENDVHIFDADFLLENDEKYLGKKPYRTYAGMKYNGGFSDHLPVYVDFWCRPAQP